MTESAIPEYLRQDMVERVARVLCRGRCDGVAHICDQESDGSCKPDKCRFWMSHKDSARDAIATMREPNLAMRKVCSFEDAEITWPAMIDAALSKSNPTQKGE